MHKRARHQLPFCWAGLESPFPPALNFLRAWNFFAGGTDRPQKQLKGRRNGDEGTGKQPGSRVS